MVPPKLPSFPSKRWMLCFSQVPLLSESLPAKHPFLPSEVWEMQPLYNDGGPPELSGLGSYSGWLSPPQADRALI